MGTIMMLALLLIAVTSIKATIAAKGEKEREDKLLEENPKAWEMVQKVKMDKQDRNRQAKVGTATSIAKMFLGK